MVYWYWRSNQVDLKVTAVTETELEGRHPTGVRYMEWMLPITPDNFYVIITSIGTISSYSNKWAPLYPIQVIQTNSNSTSRYVCIHGHVVVGINWKSNLIYTNTKHDDFTATGHKHLRSRCSQCEGCLRADCGQCTQCLDKKFGGPGRKKKACKYKKYNGIPKQTSSNSVQDCIDKLSSLADHRPVKSHASGVRPHTFTLLLTLTRCHQNLTHPGQAIITIIIIIIMCLQMHVLLACMRMQSILDALTIPYRLTIVS